MTGNHSIENSNPGQPMWYVAPLVWIAIAVLSFVVAPNWHDLLANPAESQQTGLRAAPPVVPMAGVGETAVPSASSVFTKPSYLAVDHVESF